MTPETLVLIGLAVVAVIAASVWVGHHFGSQVKATPMLDSWAADAKQFISHPIETTEAEIKKLRLAEFKNAAGALFDYSGAQAKVAEGQAEIAAQEALCMQASQYMLTLTQAMAAQKPAA